MSNIFFTMGLISYQNWSNCTVGIPISRPFTLFFSLKVHFNGKSIPQWEHHIPAITFDGGEGCDAIRPGLNYFISMIMSVA